MLYRSTVNFYAVNFLQTKAGPRYLDYFHMQIERFCTCQMAEIYDDMVECDTRGDWYHPSAAISTRRRTMEL